MNRTALLAGLFAFAVIVGGMFVLSMTKHPGRVKAATDEGPPKPTAPRADGGSFNYWLGSWDVEVKPFSRSLKLKDDERATFEWSKTVLADLVGSWANTPKTQKSGVASPLKQMVPVVDAERLHKNNDAWTDSAGREWTPIGRDALHAFWIQTRVKHGGREVLLGMDFKVAKSKLEDGEAFDFFYMISFDNAQNWKLVSELHFEREVNDPR